MPDNVFDRLARTVLDASAATTEHLLRTGRHRSATGPGYALPRHVAPPSAGGIGAGDPDDPADPDATPPLGNPMTTAGALIVGGESGGGEELLPGTEGDVLTIVAGAPAWVAPAPGGSDWSVLTNGDPADPQLVWTDDGGVIMVEGE